ncbi:NACHT domain-containing protein [Kitasatospora atroaurantiaca]|uniref:Transcriptional regulator with XRE-family HTH domain n=1 Tax=Kitasatospora atroaurantiaca TaxID=285545 RepID=A0A561EIZ9_9ACTN|nr:helix-turn-helix domain-containing protein [Kitasatospora atroaurantiaca]TWE15563.1 transcriptional regulator with XRE-family HTH domain [Kitasatospora atroaurantiaca]
MTDQLGTLLRRLRTQSGLTQEQLAERSGVSVRTIRRLETGKSTDHRLGTVNLLADALEVGPEDRQLLAATLGKAESAPAVPPPRSPEPSPIRGALADAADELAREVRRRWRREEEQRRVHDPFPLPVGWQEAPADLTDYSENIQRLEAGAAPGRVDLSGDLRSTAEVYRKISSGRLVVLGRAGSGKSILTIRFVLDFLETRAFSDPVPVIFSVGSWDPTATALRDWLIGRLLRDHPHLARRVPSGVTLAAALVDADLILPVLDGFDEIAEGLRREALEELNATSLPLVLTSRRGEFAEAVLAARTPLVLAAGIELTDLTLDDLAAYLPRTARPVARDDGDGDGEPEAVWEGVLTELRAQETPASRILARVLSTPLMVILARTMYSETQDRHPSELLNSTKFPAEHLLEEHLLAGFVPTVYRRRAPEQVVGSRPGGQRNWDPELAQRWLGYLAHHLVRLDRDRQDLAWWQIADSLRRSTRIATVVLVSALCIAGADWVVGLLVTPLGFSEVLVQGALLGPVAGLAFGSVYGVMAAFGGGVFEPARVRLRLPRAHDSIGRGPVRTFTTRFGSVLLGGFVMGVGCACALTLERALYLGIPLTNGDVIEGTLINMLAFGLIFGSAAGLVFGLMAVLEAPLDVTFAATPMGLLSSNRATVSGQILVLVPMLTLAIAGGGRLVVELLQSFLGPMNWGLSDGLFIGAVGGLGGALSYVLSFTAWGQWVVLSRIWLPLTGKLPWNMVTFLDDAYRKGVLRQTGAVYQFRHIRLQHHLGHSFRQQQSNYAPARFATLRTGRADQAVVTDRADRS